MTGELGFQSAPDLNVKEGRINVVGYYEMTGQSFNTGTVWVGPNGELRQKVENAVQGGPNNGLFTNNGTLMVEAGGDRATSLTT